VGADKLLEAVVPDAVVSDFENFGTAYRPNQPFGDLYGMSTQSRKFLFCAK
jgi:hypothetical protein